MTKQHKAPVTPPARPKPIPLAKPTLRELYEDARFARYEVVGGPGYYRISPPGGGWYSRDGVVVECRHMRQAKEAMAKAYRSVINAAAQRRVA